MKKKLYWMIRCIVIALIGIEAIWFHDTGNKTSQLTGPVSPDEPVPQELVASLETYVLELMEEYDVPGAAMVLVKGDQVIYAKGWGITDLAAQSPVTTRTLFGIGSSTRPMTSIMVASLVDDGVIAWDIPVQKIRPAFAMSIPEIAEQVTVFLRARPSEGPQINVGYGGSADDELAGNEGTYDFISEQELMPGRKTLYRYAFFAILPPESAKHENDQRSGKRSKRECI